MVPNKIVGVAIILMASASTLLMFRNSSPASEMPLAFDPPIYDVGVRYDRTGKAKFSSYLINQSGKKIQLKSVIVSCGCVAASIPPSTLLPGERILISGEINLESKNGFFQSEVGVVSSSPYFPLLKLKGYVGDIARISVPKIQLTENPQNFNVYINQSANAWRIDKFTAPPNVELFLQEKSDAPDTSSKSLLVYTFAVARKENVLSTQDSSNEIVFFLTDGHSKSLCRLPVQVSELTASPENMILFSGGSSSISQASVVVSAAKEIENMKITSDIPSVNVALVKLDACHFRIDAKYKNDLNAAPLKGSIRIHSKNASLSVPVEVAGVN